MTDCLHESIGVSQDGEDIVLCWDCGCEFAPKDVADEFAHALYTIAMHADQQGQTLILDRIRGSAFKHPEIVKTYPQLKSILSLDA